MADKHTLDLAREWAEHAKTLDEINVWPTALAAAEVILSLPDTIVDGDKLREVINIELSGYEHGTVGHHVAEGLACKLEPLLPDPPAPPTMAEIEWDDAEHGLAEATVPRLSGRLHEKVLMVEIDDLGYIRSLDPTTWEMWSLSPGRLTPTGRKYRLEPEDDTPAPSIEDKPAPEPASPRPGGCCGACPETVGGGVDCTCADNPRCPNQQPRPEDVPVGEPWQMEVDGETAIGFRNDPGNPLPWRVTYQAHSRAHWIDDNDVTLIARLVPETTEQDEEPDLAPAYTYLDKDGDEWENIDGGWVHGDTHAKRLDKREYRRGHASPPEEYGPYTSNRGHQVTSNRDRAAEVIHDTVQEWPQDDVAGVAARRLADAGLLAQALPEPNDPSIFVPNGAGWRTPKDSVVWTSIGGCVMIQRVEPGGFTPREARDLALALYAAAEHAETEDTDE